jgi:C1A family cysteine protease
MAEMSPAPFTGVLDEPKAPSEQTMLIAFGKWMRSLYRSAINVKPPSSFTWDDKGVVPPPGDQGQLAACISYAVCLGGAISYRLKTGKSISLAPRVMHLCTMGLAPEMGTNSFDFEDKVLAAGLPSPSSAAAGQAAAMSSKSECSVFDSVTRLNVSSVRRFQTAEEVKTELSSVGPVVVHMKLFNDFWQHYVGGTVYKAPAGATSNVSHAVCLIGYDDNKQCWIGVNSRGTSWGTNGRFLLQYGQCDVMVQGAAAYALTIQT